MTLFEAADAVPVPAGLAAVTCKSAGAPGTVLPLVGVTLTAAADAGPVPSALPATTVKADAMPSVRPVTVALVAVPCTVVTVPLGLGVAV